MKRDWPAIISAAIVVIMTWSGVVASWVVLRERTQIQEKQIAELQAEVRTLKADKRADEIAQDIAVIRERVEWISKGMTELQQRSQKPRGR